MTDKLSQLVAELNEYSDELALIEAYQDDRKDVKFCAVYSYYAAYSNTTKGFTIDDKRLKELGFDVNSISQKILEANKEFVKNKIKEITDTIHGLV